jgi:hypothetical protein
LFRILRGSSKKTKKHLLSPTNSSQEPKKQSPFKKTFTIELANGYGGYLPPARQHELGGYETWPARSSFLEVDAAKKIKQELLSMLQELAN